MGDTHLRQVPTIYVLWHPNYRPGAELADATYRHYTGALFKEGAPNLQVFRRSQLPAGAAIPLPIDFAPTDTVAIVPILEESLTSDPDWVSYLDELAARVDGRNQRLIPVAIDKTAVGLGGRLGPIQAMRWFEWTNRDDEMKRRKVLMELSHELCVMVRHGLMAYDQAPKQEASLRTYRDKITVFLSHSKHDAYGFQLAQAMETRIREDTRLDTFLDVTDLPPGMPFDEVLYEYTENSTLLVIQTDSYSSRAWCQREVLSAKRHRVPILVINCIDQHEDRSFPYLGNVPVFRLDPGLAVSEPDSEGTKRVVWRTVDLILRDFLWRYRVERGRTKEDGVVFLPRPPELLDLPAILYEDQLKSKVVVYPDPPIGSPQIDLLESMRSGLAFRSFTEWTAGNEA